MFAIRQVLCGGLCVVLASLSGPIAQAADIDGDGVDDSVDVCCNTPPGVAIDEQGRPLADLDRDCDGDLDDFALFMAGFSGPDTCGPEECDGLDNDRNCLIDDMGIASCGDGECYREVPVCVGGVLQTCVPGAPTVETCNGLDDDCDGTVDNDAIDAPFWYRDQDGDQYGDFFDTVQQCDQPAGYVSTNEDCNDSDPDMNPAEAEQCNDTKDNDCDGVSDCQDVSDCLPGTPCGPPSYVCEEDQCVCEPGTGDCDGNYGNGCETDTDTDVYNCGECDYECILPNAVEGCQAGACTVVECHPGWGNCDGSAPNGCETDTDTSLAHCGQCNSPCVLPHAAEVCNSGACEISICDTGWANCNGTHGDGCEYDLHTVSGTCQTGETLPSMPGDQCTSGPLRDGHGGKWYRVYLTEEDSSPFNPVDLSIRVQLQSPLQMDYDLYVYDPCGTLRGSSTQGAGATDQVVYTWDDGLGSDDSRWIYIEVRYFAGNTCDNWTLRAYGGCD